MKQTFNSFLKKLLKNPSNQTIIKVKGNDKKIKGMALYTSSNYDFDYYKISFTDHSHLIIVPAEKDISYADNVIGRARGITNQMIAKKKVVYKNKTFQLINSSDYQFCLNHFVGRPGVDIEHEVSFSDYQAKNNPSKILSLGINSYTGKRADVLASSISLSDIMVL